MNRVHSRIFYKISFILITWNGFSTTSLFSQDPKFSQYYAAPLYLNPALNGLEKDVYFGVNFRSQWKSIDLPYTTSQFSFIYPLYKKGVVYRHLGGLGLSLFNDLAGGHGGIKTFGFQLSGAYNYSLPYNTNHNISFGAQAGFYQKSINFNDLRWGSQY
nr:PorP/SprF family type IX secretion system membrane protein [Bacteroidota bacterium]